MQVLLWYSASASSFAPTPLVQIVWLSDDGAAPTLDHREGAFAIAPIQPVRKAVAVVFVPKLLAGKVACNGVPLAAGLNPLAHADRLDAGTRTCWIATENEVEKTLYEPAQHGTDVFCFITKARLAEGQPIVVCPGISEQTCGTIYLQEAWERAMQAEQFKCPNCSFSPRLKPWQPPEQQKQDSLTEVNQLIGS